MQGTRDSGVRLLLVLDRQSALHLHSAATLHYTLTITIYVVCWAPQVFSFVVYDMIEQLLVRRGIRPTVPVRLVYRTLYVVFTAFVACLLPFFGDIMVRILCRTAVFSSATTTQLYVQYCAQLALCCAQLLATQPQHRIVTPSESA